MLTQLFTQFFTWFSHNSFTILDCLELALVLYTNGQIVDMIDGLKGNEWDEVLKLEVLPPLPVDSEKNPQVQEQALKETEREKEQEEGETVFYIDL